MSERPKEYAAARHRDIDVRAEIERSKRYWNSPEGKREARRLEERRNAAIRRNRGIVKFPHLVGTRPAATATAAAWARFDGLTR